MRVVFRLDERRWRAIAAWSAVLFATVAGASFIGLAYWLGDDALRDQAAAVRLGEGGAEPPPGVGEPAVERRVIDGMPAAAGDADRYYAVVVDDLSAARPQAGLEEAPLVIEAPVEGGITRLLALFPGDAGASRIGPVRSARPYFLDWAREFDALFVHVGGSPESLEKLSASNLRSLDEFAWGRYFWRDPSRRAPHNVYTSMALLRDVDARRFSDRPARPVAAWRFKQEAPPEDRPAEDVSLTVGFSDPKYRVVWQYDPDGNDFRRGQGGTAHSVESGAIRAKNVIVQYTKMEVIDDIGRRRIATVGDGDAVIALDGLIIHGRWKKEHAGARTVFYDASGNVMRFNPGTTWIEVVPEDMPVTY